MARELRALVNLIATLEQTAGGFVPQIVETRILDSRARVSHTWQARVKAAPTLFGSYGKMYSPVCGCAWTIAHVSGVYLKRR